MFTKPCDNLENCSVCYDNNDNESVQLDCNHSFHKQCMLKWCEKSQTCPICRSDIIVCDICKGTKTITRIIETATIPFEFRTESILRNTTDGLFSIHSFDLEDILISKLIYNQLNKKMYIIN